MYENNSKIITSAKGKKKTLTATGHAYLYKMLVGNAFNFSAIRTNYVLDSSVIDLIDLEENIIQWIYKILLSEEIFFINGKKYRPGEPNDYNLKILINKLLFRYENFYLPTVKFRDEINKNPKIDPIAITHLKGNHKEFALELFNFSSTITIHIMHWICSGYQDLEINITEFIKDKKDFMDEIKYFLRKHHLKNYEAIITFRENENEQIKISKKPRVS